MMKFSREALFLGIIFLFQCATTCLAWNYANQNDWPDTCATGTRQSPINLPITTRPCTSNNIFSLSFKDSSELSLELRNYTWHGVSKVPMAHLIAQDTSGIIQIYESSSFTIHSLSEHTIDSKRYDLEVQFQFELSSETPNKTPDKRAVVSILYEKADVDAESEFVSSINQAVLSQETTYVTLKPRHMIGKTFNNHTNVLLYKGSNTQPSCDEEVNWYVLESPLKVSENDLKFAKNTYFAGSSSGYNHQTGNARDLQAGNSRVIQKLCEVTDLKDQPLHYNGVLVIGILLIGTYIGLYFTYGKRQERLEGEEHIFSGNNLWTLHPVYSIINIPSRDGYSRRSRISILFIEWLTQLSITSLWYSSYQFSTYGDILTVSILSIICTIPIAFLLGLFFRRYYQRVREISSKMHSDEVFIRSERLTFLAICLGVSFIDFLVMYSLVDDLIGKLSRYAVYSFLFALVIQECVIEPFFIFLAGKLSIILPILKLRGYYFEGEITQYNIIDQ